MRDLKKLGERTFFDHSYEAGTRKSLSKYYAISRRSHQMYRDLLLSECSGRTVLDYGCGTGATALLLAEHGAKVTGIDISEVAIRIARKQAALRGFSDAAFSVMDAEALEFKVNSFDMVCGMGILHHLQLQRALSELVRVLKPTGKALFLEPMGHNPAINLYRKFTPDLRTSNEHPLTRGDLTLAARSFEEATWRFFHVFTLLAVPWRRTKWFPSLLATLERLDEHLCERSPRARSLAWQVLMVLDGPQKRSTLMTEGSQ
jgi:SAM-dependent methyltransferase